MNGAPISEKDYEAEDDCRTLERAEEVKSSPKRFNLAKKAGMRKMNAISRAFKKTKIGKGRKGKSSIVMG